jgi:hypothetical protein
MQGAKHIFGSTKGCIITIMFPSLLPGALSPTYIGCSSSTGSCSVYNDLLPMVFTLPKCHSSTCQLEGAIDFISVIFP